MALFPGYLTASGHFKPGSSGHMRPGHETVYPSSFLPTAVVARPFDIVSIDILSFSIVYVACQVGN